MYAFMVVESVKPLQYGLQIPGVYGMNKSGSSKLLSHLIVIYAHMQSSLASELTHFPFYVGSCECLDSTCLLYKVGIALCYRVNS